MFGTDTYVFLLTLQCNDLVMAELLMEGKGVDVSGAWALAAENKEANRDLLQLLQVRRYGF